MLLKPQQLISQFSVIMLVAALAACESTGDTKADNSGEIHLELGVRYLGMNKLELARENLLEALEEDSRNTKAHNALAILYEKLNQFDNAKEHYEKALDLNANDLSVKNNFGRFLCDHGELQQGMEMLSETSSSPLNDKPWMALTNAGRCELGLDQKQLAENYFRQALQFNRSYAPALAELQKIAYQNGNYSEAKATLQRYLSVAGHTAETLWFAAQTERALGNKELAKGYKKLLMQKFPFSNEAKNITGIND